MSRAVRIAIPCAAAALIAAVPLAVADTFLLKVFTFVGLNVLVVVGLALLFGYAGQVSLGHAAFVGLGAYTCAYATVQWRAPWPLALLGAVVVSALGGVLVALPSLKLKGHYLAMATLGFGELATLAFKEAAGITGGVNGMSGIPYPSLGPLQITTAAGLYWLVWAIAGLCVVIAVNLTTLRPGRAMRALHGSELGATASGVDVTGVKVRVFVVSAAMAGVSGALYASAVGFISPSLFTLQASVGLLAMAVIGGTGSIAGPIVAAALLTLVQYCDSLIPGLAGAQADAIQAYQPDAYGLAIVVVVLFAAGGIGALWRRGGEARESS